MFLFGSTIFLRDYWCVLSIIFLMYLSTFSLLHLPCFHFCSISNSSLNYSQKKSRIIFGISFQGTLGILALNTDMFHFLIFSNTNFANLLKLPKKQLVHITHSTKANQVKMSACLSVCLYGKGSLTSRRKLLKMLVCVSNWMPKMVKCNSSLSPFTC